MGLPMLAASLCPTLLAVALALAPGEKPLVAAGFARQDITPGYPVRLSGFGFRRAESEGVQQRVWAKAMALGADQPWVLVTVDNLGCSLAIRQQLLDRLKTRGVTAARFAIAASHTHTAPMLEGVCPTLFGQPIPPDHQDHIRRYTAEFTDNLEKVVLAALADRRKCELGWAVGSAGFAMNRRTRGGPVDHDLPILVARDPRTDKVHGIWAAYACHAVTLSHNKVGGDWPGHAQQAIEDAFPGATALVSIGCGADSNPSSGVTGDKVEIASRQGIEIGREVERLVKAGLAPLGPPTTATLETISLAFATPPTREEFQARAQKQDYIGHHARVQLARLDKGDPLRANIPYPVQTWSFGKDLAMVFLPGEVVVDYALRLKKELDGKRLWINAYTNDSPCYIPSERILKEGGYEGGGAMTYYDQPAPFRPGLEQQIIAAAEKPLLADFKSTAADTAKTQGTQARDPNQALAAWRVPPGTRLELVAHEPLVQSPVAIDFAPDGSLLVAEMRDYPLGMNGDYQPGGLVRRLTDTNADGRYDQSTILVDNIPFPTGVTAWRDGVLICAAPDILLARDTDRDGKADVVEKLYSGFGTGNYQARVNSLTPGLDGWLHGSCGLFGGKIKSHKTGKVLDLGDRDFRIHPDTGAIEPATGRTQQGRVRDAVGNWFGCDNSVLAWHLALPDEYLRRNPAIRHPRVIQSVAADDAANRLIPAGSVQMFKLSGPVGAVTSACGIGTYDDTLLGKGYANSLFTCEPVHHVVHRLELQARGATFAGYRPAAEADHSFLASSDPWARPVQVKAGPDGCLYVVDMYRFLIEHPRWIPSEDLEKIDTRAGAELGRIYRLRPADDAPRPIVDLATAPLATVLKQMETPSAAGRDRAMQQLLWRNDKEACPPLRQLVLTHPDGLVRLQALATLALLAGPDETLVLKALADPHAGVRRQGARLAGTLAPSATVRDALIPLANDAEGGTRLQAVLSLGEWKDTTAARALGQAAGSHAQDTFLVSAALSGTHAESLGEFATAALQARPDPSPAFFGRLAEAVASNETALKQLALAVLLPGANAPPGEPVRRAGPWLVALDGTGNRLARLGPEVAGALRELAGISRAMLADAKSSETDKLSAIQLLGRLQADRQADLALVARLLAPAETPALRQAALTRLATIDSPEAASLLVEQFRALSPALRGAALDALASRPAWTKLLLDAVESGTITPGQVDAIRRQRLVDHRDASLRDRARKLLAGGGDAARAEVLARYQPATTLPGDPVQGRDLFRRHCSVCHRLEDHGNAVGPDLRTVAGKSPASLLLEIIDPNRNLDSRYLVYAATLKSGQTVAGIIASENSTSLTLRQADGQERTLLRAELESLETTGKSLMPEGLEREITPEAMAHVLAYVARQESPAKSLPGNTPAQVAITPSGAPLQAAQAEVRGASINFETEFGNIGNWHGQQDTVRWKLKSPQPATLDLWIDFACAQASAGNTLTVETPDGKLSWKVPSTGPDWSAYQQLKIGQVKIPAGESTLTVRPAGAVTNALIDLRTIYLTAQGTPPVLVAKGQTDVPQSPGELVRAMETGTGDKALVQKLLEQRSDWAADMLQDMTNGLAEGKEEYKAIPLIWRVAIAQGRKGDPATLKAILRVSLPALEADMRDWQAVVVGGGLINGSTLAGRWPHGEYRDLLTREDDLRKRWDRAIALSFAMADNPKVNTGTRYDALRMVALSADRARALAVLARYLKPGTDDELVMGAVSGLGDIPPDEDSKVAPLLLEALPRLNEENLGMALGALVRTPSRATALLEAIAAGKLPAGKVTNPHKKALLDSADASVRARARDLLK